MSAFNQAHESADADDQTTVDAAEVPESDTATAALSEATAAETEVAQEDDTAEQLEDEQEQLEEVEDEVAQESDGLSPVAARLLSQSLTRIVGKQQATKIHAMENYTSGRSGQREARAMALEGIKETLKQFWEAIKAQLKKFYNKVKTYFVKAFSAARKLKDRAEKLQQKASGTVGSIEEKSFSFGQTKAIAVDGKYNDANGALSGLKDVRTVVTSLLKVEKADKYESIIDTAATKVEKLVGELKKDTKADVVAGAVEVIAKLKEVSGSVGIGTNSNPETKLKEMYVPKDSDDTLEVSTSLPGGKAIFSITANQNAKAGDVETLTKVIKNTRTVIGNDKYNPRDVSEGDVKTLTASQVDKVCDDVIEIAETAYTYEKAWEKRDKFQAKLEREIDSIVKDVNNEDDMDSRAQRIVRNFATSFTTSVRRRTSFESQFIGYALNTASAFLNYGERSLAQHKAK